MFALEVKRWPRLLARFCDYCLLYLVLGAISLALPYFYGPFFYYFLALWIPFLWVPLEALLLSKWASTPGKVLFGFSVQGEERSPLTYKQALRRTLFLPGRPGKVVQRMISWKRKLFGFVTSALFALAALYGNGLALWTTGLERGDLSGWVQYSSNEVGFTVAFPKEPEEVSKALPIPDSDKVLNYQEISTKQSKKIHYSVSHLNLPGKWRLASNTTLLKAVLDILVQHEPGSALLAKEFRSYAGLRVLDYHMHKGDEEMQGRLIVVGKTLYKLTVTYPTGQAEQSEIIAFLDSFEVS